MAKADPPKKSKPKVGAAAAVGASSGARYFFIKGFKPLNTETTFYKNTVPRTFKYINNEGRTVKVFSDEAVQRITTTKSFSKLGVVTKSTLTETVEGLRQSTRSTTLSPRGKLKGLGQIVIQETKPLEAAGKGYLPRKGPSKRQGGKGGGKGKYTTKSITYAKEGYPTPKKGRIPKGGNPVISKLDRVTNLTGNMVSYTDDFGNKAVIAGTKTSNVYTALASPQSKVGKYVQSKSGSQLLSAATKVAKGASKLVGAANVVGAGILAYDTGRAIQDYAGTPHQKKQMKKYKDKGGFSATGGY